VAVAELNALGLNYTLSSGAGKQAKTAPAKEKRYRPAFILAAVAVAIELIVAAHSAGTPAICVRAALISSVALIVRSSPRALALGQIQNGADTIRWPSAVHKAT
jgi:hypothetical protein